MINKITYKILEYYQRFGPYSFLFMILLDKYIIKYIYIFTYQNIRKHNVIFTNNIIK